MDDTANPGPDAGRKNPLAGTPTPAPAPTPAKRRPVHGAFAAPMSWPRRRRIGALLAAVAIATTGGVAIAASDTPTPTVSPDAPRSPDGVKQEKGMLDKKQKIAKGMLTKGMHGGMGMGMGRGAVLHGEFTTPNGEDDFRTQMIQTGTVDSVSGDKLTVRSADGYTHEYALTSDTMVNGARSWSAESRGGVATGQNVTVMATVQDGAATATQVRGGDAKAARAEGDVKMRMFRGEGGMPGMGAPDEKMRREMRKAPGESAVPSPAAGN